MAVLSRSAAVVAVACAAGCYDPALRDCTVTCTGSGDCATGQSCEAGWCVEPGATCDTGSATQVPLHVQVMGPGQISVDATRSCTADCTYQVAAGVHELVATARDGHVFRMWTGACTGTAETCTVTPPTAKPAVARFDGEAP